MLDFGRVSLNECIPYRMYVVYIVCQFGLSNVPLKYKIHHLRGLPEFWWESKRVFNFFLTIPVDAAKSEFSAEPGISNPFLVGTHFSKIFGDTSFQISVDFDRKFCLVLFNLTRGTLSLILSLLGRNASKLQMDTGDLNFNTLNVSIKS